MNTQYRQTSKRFFALTDGLHIAEVRAMDKVELEDAQDAAEAATDGNWWWEVARVTTGEE